MLNEMTQPSTFSMTRVENNLNAMRTLQSNTPCLNDLKGYSGWGGLREAIYTPSIYRKLKSVLSEAEIVSIKQTLKSAYFTPKALVQWMYQWIAATGFQPTQVLEPSAGHGIFFEAMPTAMRQSATLTAVEMDSVSGRVLQALYPQVALHVQPFETFQPKPDFDLIVGNPPFGQITVTDTDHADITHCSIHHYFVAKALRLLVPNGLLAMIVPRYFLDAKDKHLRQTIHQEGGTLVAAYRLPDNLFADARVTVDIVFLKKTTGNADWVEVKPWSRNAERVHINPYFLAHPDHVLGELELIEIYGRKEMTCRSDSRDILKCLNERLCEKADTKTPRRHSIDSLNSIQVKLKQVKEEIRRLLKQKQTLLHLQQQIDATQKQLNTLCQAAAQVA